MDTHSNQPQIGGDTEPEINLDGTFPGSNAGDAPNIALNMGLPGVDDELGEEPPEIDQDLEAEWAETFQILLNQNDLGSSSSVDELHEAWSAVKMMAEHLRMNVNTLPEDEIADVVTSFASVVGAGLARPDGNERLLQACLETCLVLCSDSFHSLQNLQDHGAIPRLFQILKNRSNFGISISLLVFEIVNLVAMRDVMHSAIIAADLPEVLASLVQQHTKTTTFNESDQEFVLAVRAWAILCKLYGKQESGRGADIVLSLIDFVLIYVGFLEHIVTVQPGRVMGIIWNSEDMMNDIHLLSTADRNKPWLGKIVPVVTSIISLKPGKVELNSKGILILAQLMFEPTLMSYFVAEKTRMLSVLSILKRESSSASEMYRTIELLREPLEELANDEDDDDELLSDSPTFVFIVCHSKNIQISRKVALALQEKGFDVVFCGIQASDEDVKAAYAGIVFLPEILPIDHVEMDIDYTRVEIERRELMESIFNLCREPEQTNLLQRIARKSIFYEVEEKSNSDELIADVLNEVEYLITEMFPNYLNEDEQQVDDAVQEEEEEIPQPVFPDRDANDTMIHEAQVVDMVGDILRTMAEMQSEIQRLSVQLAELKGNLDPA